MILAAPTNSLIAALDQLGVGDQPLHCGESRWAVMGDNNEYGLTYGSIVPSICHKPSAIWELAASNEHSQ